MSLESLTAIAYVAVAPSVEEAPISAVEPDQTRKVAQLTPDADSPFILVGAATAGGYCALIDARRSDSAPTAHRRQKVWKVAESLHELYLDIGVSLQAIPYWYHHELRPYLLPARSSAMTASTNSSGGR
jgi:hypothetical protein